MYSTQLLITITPDQLGELVRGAVRSELANYVPPLPEGANLPELLTRKQTAEVLQITLVTLHTWSKVTDERAAILLPIKIGTNVRYRRADVLAAMKERRNGKTKR